MQQVGRFQILGRIGAGGMGEVYRARDDQLQREIAIKILAAPAAGDETARARLIREARAAAALNHPHICTIYDAGESEGQGYIAMELVEGEPLSTHLARGPLPVSDVINYGLQLSDALTHAHERDIIHRDLKPANVILTSKNRIKVLDFGLAKRLDDTAQTTSTDVQLTRPGAVIGTPAYMAPEQLRGEAADARSDIWALGVMLYEMASGVRPFEGRTLPELSAAILTQQPRPMDAQVPAELQAIIAKCLARQSVERYQRSGEVHAALEAIRSGVVTEHATRPWRSKRARRVAAWCAGAIVLMGGVWGVYTMMRTRVDSLAVLPLTNLSGDPQQEYFVDGMTDALISDLGKTKGLKRVIARTSVMRYKGTRKPLREVARELDVDAVLTGAVVRSGERVRVSLELIDPDTERQLWSDVYERNMRDVLALQTDTARDIAKKIGLAAPAAPAARPQIHPDAVDAYLKGKFLLDKTSPKDLETALRYFELALQKDPRYALPHVGIAKVWLQRSRFLTGGENGLATARAEANRAMQLDPSLAQAHYTLARIDNRELKWDDGMLEFQRALDLDPNDPEICSQNLFVSLFRGRTASDAEVERCAAIDPLNPQLEMGIGTYLRDAGRTDEAIAVFEKLLKLDSDYSHARYALFMAYREKGRTTDAYQTLRRHRQLLGEQDIVDALDRGWRAGGFAAAMLESAKAYEKQVQKGPVAAGTIALAYLYAGDRQHALDWLEKAVATKAMSGELKIDRRWYDLRSEPRYQELLRKMNLPV